MLQRTVDSLRDLAPIILAVAFFQVMALQQLLPDIRGANVGLLCAVA